MLQDSQAYASEQSAASVSRPSTVMYSTSARQPLWAGSSNLDTAGPRSFRLPASSGDACPPGQHVSSSMPRSIPAALSRASSSASARDSDIQNQPNNVPDAAAHVLNAGPKVCLFISYYHSESLMCCVHSALLQSLDTMSKYSLVPLDLCCSRT